ncbi:hypothetical protein [Sorangium sp. So ce854]|uniref:hypothetical protein n=1 Tax=Sorangium sp. So ce854 TaxID=3133322 RepID=UPI003F6382ED
MSRRYDDGVMFINESARALDVVPAGARDDDSAGSVQRDFVRIRRHQVIIDTANVEALRLLNTHAREFPRGRLVAEREALLRQLR